MVSGDEGDRPDPTRGFEPLAVSVIPDGQEIVLRYRRAEFIEGEIRLPDGRPARGVPVTVLQGNETIDSACTQDGHFRVLGLAGEEHRIRAGSDALGWIDVEHVVPGRAKVVLTLR